MNSLAIIALINAALAFLEKVIPKVKDWAEDGEVTEEEQMEVWERYQALKKAVESDERFKGDHWKPSDES